MKKILPISVIIAIIILTAIFLFLYFDEQEGYLTSKAKFIDSDKSDIIQENLDSNFTYPEKVLLEVPFTPQAPFGNWDDVRQDYGCEEAAILMAMYWVLDKDLTPEKALEEIIALAEFEEEKYGHFHDTSTQDTLKLLKDYFDYDNAYVEFDIGVEDIKNQLARGNLVIVPIDGTKVNNPYYTPPGPFVHKIVIIGYDEKTQEFITHDPGTKNGEAYRYSYDILEAALMDYKTGFQEPVDEIKTAMLVVKK